MRHMTNKAMWSITLIIEGGLLSCLGLTAWSGSTPPGLSKKIAMEKPAPGRTPRDLGTKKPMLTLNKAFKSDRAVLRNDYKAAKRALLLKMKQGEITKEQYVTQKKTLTDQFKKDREALRDKYQLKREELQATKRQEKDEDKADAQEDREAEEETTTPTK